MVQRLTQQFVSIEKQKQKGRPHAATKQDVLNAIHNHKTTSATEIAKQLNIGRATVYRRLQEITPEETSKALGIIHEAELNPAQTQYDIFQKIPEIKEFYANLRYKRNNSEKYSKKLVRGIFNICLHLNKVPSALTLENCAEIVLKIKREEEPRLEVNRTRRVLRAWFSYKGVSAQRLTNVGIDTREVRVGADRSMARLSRLQRARFMTVIGKKVQENWVSKNGLYKLRFAENEVLAFAVLELPYFLFYTGTRISAALSVEWGNSVKFGSNAVTVRVVDKGRHKGVTWFKTLIGEARDSFVLFYRRVGCPEEGRVFPFEYNALRCFFVECYERTGVAGWLWRGMPFHVWRHTAAQDMLEASDWNYGLVAATLGWESIRALKQNYGRMPSSSQVRGLMKAMGLPFKDEKKKFVF